MIVKILAPSATFKGVSYNTDKIEDDRGELMKVENFGALQVLDQLRPQDYINYLEARSATNPRIRYPQFHAVISCRGKSHTKEQLTDLATKWLKGMGYGKQPYLLVFHKDTANNHIHIVSTRVDGNGRKINDSYEKIRAYQVLNQLMELDQNKQFLKDVESAFGYHFSTRAQFMLLLESQGYSLRLDGDSYRISKYGLHQGTVDLSKVDAIRKGYQKDLDRLAQLRAIIDKYLKVYDPTIFPVSVPTVKGVPSKLTGYSSKLVEYLAAKFGIQVLFHGKPGMPPYGYTLIDHSRRQVYKGGEVMPLEKLKGPAEFISMDMVQHSSPSFSASISDGYPGDFEGQETDRSETFAEQSAEQETTSFLADINLDLADDIDDEAILGRNRQRKRKARTNTR
ncbi:relaxase/mobilization nuclease domain-containing protein [Nubsella zeaxanthinifaciens]|uniref:relaxase/mobilization nuclease domain-containing protein n=1 Tax=Nubsella zeaxanthinifaciens TaxID=392412 RepID=UPI003D01FA2D